MLFELVQKNFLTIKDAAAQIHISEETFQEKMECYEKGEDENNKYAL